MIRDSLYRKILERLDDDLDGTVFEHCAADLLRTDWPTLAPVPGGFDFGVDGAVDRQAGPLLVATTQDAVLLNLKKSLESYLNSGGMIRDVILATSQKLSPRREQNLEKAARKAGFTLRNIYSRQGMADRIYPNRRWRLDLLGLTGAPGALSLFPVSDRPLVAQPLIGRAADLDWLLKTTGDGLLVGQPGSGKTFLMHVAARDAGGLFVVHEDATMIADDIREMSPKFIVIDDAHVRLPLVRSLRQIRDQIGGTFRILANCWPGDQETTLRALGDTTSSRLLELLTRDEIIDVLKGVGIAGPREVVHELVNQASGSPGRAVTFARLLLQGKGATVATADALFDDVRHTFSRLVGDHATVILAAFAVGGDSGMRLHSVSEYLGIPAAELLIAVTQLDAGGVLTDAGGRLVVRPAALRHALVRDRFFAGGKSLKIEPLLDLVENRDEALLTLLGAKARGGIVPDALLQPLLQQSQSSTPWSAFVRFGTAEAKWVLEQHPELLTSVGDAALDSWPEGAIPRLLTAAVNDSRSTRQHTDHPMRLIGSWIASGRPRISEAVARRRRLADEAIAWFNTGGDADVAQQAFAAVLSPVFEDISSSPGSQQAITITRGILTIEEMESLQALWPRIFGVLSQRPPRTWSGFFDLIQTWLYPQIGVLIPDAIANRMTPFALRMAQDLASISTGRPAVIHMLRKIIFRTDHELQVDIDPEFEILYPVSEFGTDWRVEQENQLKEAQSLASQWINERPALIAKKLVDYQREAISASITYPQWSVEVCSQIAAKTDQPLVWAEALRDAGASGEFLRPFMARLAESGDTQAHEFLCSSLDTPLAFAALTAVLTAQNPPSDLVELSLTRLKGMAGALSFWCAQGLVREDLIEALLGHPETAIAAAAAGGLWHREGSKALSRNGWRVAIMKSGEDPDFNLEAVFRAHPDIAAEWLANRMAEKSDVFWRRSHLVKTAIAALNDDQRRRLLSEIPIDVWTHDLIVLLVGDDVKLYQTVLECDRLKDFRLGPLHGHIDEKWVMKATLASQAGYSPQTLAEAVMVLESWTGPVSQAWNGFVERFEWLKQQPDESMQAVGKIGSELATEKRDRARVHEREAAVHGYD